MGQVIHLAQEIMKSIFRNNGPSEFGPLFPEIHAGQVGQVYLAQYFFRINFEFFFHLSQVNLAQTFFQFFSMFH